MKYLFTDFSILHSLSDIENPTVTDALCAMVTLCGYRPPLSALADVLSVLSAGGMLTVDCDNHAEGLLNPDAMIALTDTGREAVTVGGVSRLLSSLRERAERKLMQSFCERERSAVSPMPLDREAFDSVGTTDHRQGFFLMDQGNGFLTLTVEDDDTAVDDELESIATASVSARPGAMRDALIDLLDVAEGLLRGNTRTRKVAIHGVDRTLVLTFARAACEDGATALHVTAAPLRYNRTRFVGKRDGELDYAQCGNPVLSAYWSPDCSALARTLLPVAALAGGDVMDEDLSARIHDLYSAVL